MSISLVVIMMDRITHELKKFRYVTGTPSPDIDSGRTDMKFSRCLNGIQDHRPASCVKLIPIAVSNQLYK